MVGIKPQLDFHIERGESRALCNSRCRITRSNREEGPGGGSISKKLLRVRQRYDERLVGGRTEDEEKRE